MSAVAKAALLTPDQLILGYSKAINHKEWVPMAIDGIQIKHLFPRIIQVSEAAEDLTYNEIEEIGTAIKTGKNRNEWTLQQAATMVALCEKAIKKWKNSQPLQSMWHIFSKKSPESTRILAQISVYQSMRQNHLEIYSQFDDQDGVVLSAARREQNSNTFESFTILDESEANQFELQPIVKGE